MRNRWILSAHFQEIRWEVRLLPTTALYRLSHLKPPLCSKYYFSDFKMRNKKTLSPGKPLNIIPLKFPVRFDVSSAQVLSTESYYLSQSKDHIPEPNSQKA